MQQTRQASLAEGWRAMQRNDLRAAEDIARSALRSEPRALEFVELLAASCYGQGRFREAIAPLREIFANLGPKGAGYSLGYCYFATGDEKSAEIVLREEIRRFPDSVESQNLLGVLLARQRRHEEALALFAAAIARHPEFGGTYNNIGNTLSELGRHAEAIPHLRKAIEIQPADVQARCNLGNAYRALGRHEEAVECLEEAVRIAPDDFEAHNGLGVVYRDSERYDRAVACFQKALSINPVHSPAWHNLGLALDHLNRHEEAVQALEKALSVRPDFAETYVGLGNAFQRLRRLEAAISAYRKAVSLQGDLVSAHSGLGTSLQELKRFEEAVACFEKVLAIDPHDDSAPTALAWARAASCDWRDYDARLQELRAHVREGRSRVEPFTFLALCQDPGEQRLCAERYLAHRFPKPFPALYAGGTARREKIRLAYLSADFGEHPVANCTHELFRLHDRSRFEVFGVALGHDDRSEMRAKLEKTFDRFLDARRMSDSEAAAAIRDLGVDIAVDLMGYTKGCRPGILAHRPAPLQVAYLGYPGTTGADYVDYLLADRFVVPEEHRKHYSECVVYLPDSYLANHSLRMAEEPPGGRTAAGLPEGAFVFCCFNNGYKIAPDVFGAWMRLLRKVEGSVLWLYGDNPVAERNLGSEAARHGVDPRRLIFARRLKRIEEHYGRYRLADLFLDTSYNAHVTACDALWAGLPVLTCAGGSFASRVAGGLLEVQGLSELATTNLADYESLALSLATDRERLRSIREKVDLARRSGPLFDADRFRRHIESAFTTMWETRLRGEEPRAFAVERAQ
jgi:predicted O-linked N-acetylglucosamine transferase (SPINDLY family)